MITIIPGASDDRPRIHAWQLPFAITLTGDPFRDLAHLVTLGIDRRDENGNPISRQDFEWLYAELLREAILGR